MIGYISSKNHNQCNQVLAEIAYELTRQNVKICACIQNNSENASNLHCDMDVQIIPGNKRFRISQSLGEHSRGCRLDTNGLIAAVAEMEQQFQAQPDVLIINKFGKTEAEGGGFRELIAKAVEANSVVLIAVNDLNKEAFLSFADGFHEELPAEYSAVFNWTALQLKDMMNGAYAFI